jgi:hypothetical protein
MEKQFGVSQTLVIYQLKLLLRTRGHDIHMYVATGLRPITAGELRHTYKNKKKSGYQEELQSMSNVEAKRDS